jgi:Ca-activated chloride channel family protein
MSFAAPLVLLGLVALPVLLALYVARQRGGRRAREAFVAAPLAVSVIPHRPGWRRHAPLLVFALALAVLIVAAARPRTSDAVIVKNASIMLANDDSGSMAATDVKPSRLGAVETAAKRFLASVPTSVSVGIMAFDQTPTVLQSPTTDRTAARNAYAGLRPHGGTAIGTAIQEAVHVLTSETVGARPPAAIVLLSDGSSQVGVNPVTAAKAAAKAHIPIYTVALGTPTGTIAVKEKTKKGPSKSVTEKVPPDPAGLAKIAKASGGEAFTAQNAQHLSAVYEHLGAKLSHRRVVKPLTAGFAGGALALLALGSALSLRWFGRLI